jgi:hypothetical protein
MLNKIVLSMVLMMLLQVAEAQPGWQQRVKYKMDVNLDVTTHILKGKQNIEYTNNSPDTLRVLYFHMYWNAFQPNSMMDVRSRELGKRVINGSNDWDFRVADRISKLKPDETGYQKMVALKMNGKAQKLDLQETILRVELTSPIAPKAKVVLETEFEARVPIQIRRSGRENAEGVRYSMSQWYPKLAAYDDQGWHANPYVGREFYGVWGDFDVNITLDRNFIVAGTGYLQNSGEIGYGYEAPGTKVTRPAGTSLTWKFSAPNVHDFVWAADPDFKHESASVRDGFTIHVFYKISLPHLQKVFEGLSQRDRTAFRNDPGLFARYYEAEWKSVIPRMQKALPYIEDQFGKYAYKQFSFIQGGDGGMEYPMATLLKGAGDGVVFHEFLHSWFPMMYGSNEALYAWMDEGFAQFAENRVAAFLQNDTTGNAQADSYDSYFKLAASDYEEPLTTHADHFKTKYGYTVSSYQKGAVFYSQLGYVIGEQNLRRMFIEIRRKYLFKHVDPKTMLRVAEGVSGMQLGWYGRGMINTTNTINYSIDSLWQQGNKTMIRLRNMGQFSMPIDLMITYKDGSRHLAYIPQYQSFGAKPAEDTTIRRTVHEPWKWTHPNYVVEVEGGLLNIKTVEIDPSMRLADTDRRNNKLELNW